MKITIEADTLKDNAEDIEVIEDVIKANSLKAFIKDFETGLLKTLPENKQLAYYELKGDYL